MRPIRYLFCKSLAAWFISLPDDGSYTLNDFIDNDLFYIFQRIVFGVKQKV